MLLRELIKGIDVVLQTPDAAEARICDITEDSRTVLPGSLFIARQGGKTDGRRFIDQAIVAGATAILTTTEDAPPHDLPAGVAWVTASDVTHAVAYLAERFFRSPAKKLALVGVTGTNGKTTVSTLVYQILNASRKRCGLIGTVTVDDGRGPVVATMTTPPALELSLSLSRMVEAEYKAAALEVSSHALDQNRAAALDFAVAIFTNLTGDHLDYHGTLEHYAASKARLFDSLGAQACAIVNADDPGLKRMLQDCAAKVLRCSLDVTSDADCIAEIRESSSHGSDLVLRGPWGEITGRVALFGRYNAMNCLQAVAAAHSLGIARDRIESALRSLSAPAGRLELVTRETGEPEAFSVFVDYSHTDDALANALRAVRPLVQTSGASLRVLFGCGGDKDRTKRPRMGRVACELADVVYVTSDNPRTEEPDAIIREIMSGAQATSCDQMHQEPDRRTAICRAVAECQPGDVLLVAGKGHEDYQILPDGRGGVRRISFDDRVVVREALRASCGDETQPAHAVVIPKRENVKP